MLTQAIGDFLPAAVAVALSPVPIVAVVLVLDGSRARASGPAFAMGWIAGLTVVSVVVVVVIGSGDPTDVATGVGWMDVGIGVIFLVMAAGQWKQRPKPGEDPKMPGWMSTMSAVSWPKAALLGAALSGANPKNVALTLAASASIAQAGLDAGDTAIAIAAFVAIGSVTVVGAVGCYLIAAEDDRASVGVDPAVHVCEQRHDHDGRAAHPRRQADRRRARRPLDLTFRERVSRRHSGAGDPRKRQSAGRMPLIVTSIVAPLGVS